jgi:hypothetical protein
VFIEPAAIPIGLGKGGGTLDSEPRIVGGELHEWRKFQGA